MKVNIVNNSEFELPEYKTEGDAGMDLRADLKRYYADWGRPPKDTEITLRIEPFQQYVIPTGLFIALPNKVFTEKIQEEPWFFDMASDLEIVFEAQIRPRSGLAAKYGVTVVNTPGTIDSGYRGEIKVILICLNKNGYTITHGDRIAQMVISRAVKIKLNPVEILDDTQRGVGGFGHTGNQ